MQGATARPDGMPDVLLTAYPEQVTAEERKPLGVLVEFIQANIRDLVDWVHVLPPFPSTSDHGFAPTDHLAIDDRLGSWADLAALATTHPFSIDLILNHVSKSHPWFRGFLDGDPDYHDYFIKVPDEVDFATVARSRHHPPISRFRSHDGEIDVWTRYGPDQVDLNYRNPQVVAEIEKLIVEYAERGASGLRLDAIAFIWKDSGTNCANRPELFPILQRFRKLAASLNPPIRLIAEADVVDGRNPYVGESQSLAHAAFRYDAAPIILHAILSRSNTRFSQWVDALSRQKVHDGVLNLICTHDGIYMRPVAPPLDERAQAILEHHTRRGGGVVVKRLVEGELRTYELNVSVASLLDTGDGLLDKRLLSALSLLVTLPGSAAIYLGALLGIPNATLVSDTTDGFSSREICRGSTSLERAKLTLAKPYIDRLRAYVRVRRRIDALAPSAPIFSIQLPPSVLGFERRGSVWWLRLYINLAAQPVSVEVPPESLDAITIRRLAERIELGSLEPVIIIGRL